MDAELPDFYSQQLGGNIELPPTADPKPVEVADSFNAGCPPVSRSSFRRLPIERIRKDQIWVRRFDPAGPSTDKWQVSTDGGTGPVFWDGKELYYSRLTGA